MRAGLALVALAWLALASSDRAGAEHEVQYRFTVLGYVKDTTGRPVGGQRVEVTRDKTGLAYAGETDAQGLYVIVARLGDETLGERLTLRIGDARTAVTVRFEADNHQDERGMRVDLEGVRWLSRPAWFRSTLSRILAAPPR